MTGAEYNSKSKHIIFCNCRGNIVPRDRINVVNKYLGSVPAAVTRINDLCGVAAKKRNLLQDLFARDEDYLVIGCYQRTMSILLDHDRNHPVLNSSRHINIMESSAADSIQIIKEFCEGSDKKTVITELEHDREWPSWYPILDYERCTACGQCADFCLFGVYEKTDEGVKVVNPEGCKENCPACGRICPAAAIIFPKYRHGGAISGSDEIDEFAEQQRQVQDVEQILGNDIYSSLQRRKAKRQSIIRLEAIKKANDERDNALKEI